MHVYALIKISLHEVFMNMLWSMCLFSMEIGESKREKNKNFFMIIAAP